jgi:hypothetical protein
MTPHEWSKPFSVPGTMIRIRAFKCRGCEAVRFNESDTNYDLTKVPPDCDVARPMVARGAFRWDLARVVPTFEWSA